MTRLSCSGRCRSTPRWPVPARAIRLDRPTQQAGAQRGHAAPGNDRTGAVKPSLCARGATPSTFHVKALDATTFRYATPRSGLPTRDVTKRNETDRLGLSLYASAMSRPCTVSAQITKTDTAMNTIAHTGYHGNHANATSAHNTAMITPTVRAHTAPLNR